MVQQRKLIQQICDRMIETAASTYSLVLPFVKNWDSLWFDSNHWKENLHSKQLKYVLNISCYYFINTKIQISL